MRPNYLSAIISLYLFVGFVPAQVSKTPVADRPDFENETVSIINEIRLDPKKYSKLIESYKYRVKGNVMSLPGNKPLLLREGKPVLTETTRVLGRIAGLTAFSRSKGFDKTARTQLRDLLLDDTIGHKGLDGSNLAQRLRKVGQYSGRAGENITYGAESPLQTIMMMLIDDGIKSRPHRKSLLSREFSQIGAACGINAKQRPICVFVFGATTRAYQL